MRQFVGASTHSVRELALAAASPIEGEENYALGRIGAGAAGLR